MDETSAVALLHRDVREIRDDIKALIKSVAAVSPARCDKHEERFEAHTDKIQSIASRQDTYEAAVAALKADHAERRTDSGHRWQQVAVVIALVSAIGALVLPFVR